jgi:hypothetical protein
MAQNSYIVFGALVAAVGVVVGAILLAIDRHQHGADEQMDLFKETQAKKHKRERRAAV